jgi:hypothetical protein
VKITKGLLARMLDEGTEPGGVAVAKPPRRAFFPSAKPSPGLSGDWRIVGSPGFIKVVGYGKEYSVDSRTEAVKLIAELRAEQEALRKSSPSAASPLEVGERRERSDAVDEVPSQMGAGLHPEEPASLFPSLMRRSA